MRLTGVGFCSLQQPLPGQPISLFHADSGTGDLGGHNIEISRSRFQVLCGFTKHRLEQQLGDGVSLDPCPLPGTHNTPQIWASRPEPVGKMTSRALLICQKRLKLGCCNRVHGHTRSFQTNEADEKQSCCYGASRAQPGLWQERVCVPSNKTLLEQWMVSHKAPILNTLTPWSRDIT